jgi:hypothetical protein
VVGDGFETGSDRFHSPLPGATPESLNTTRFRWNSVAAPGQSIARSQGATDCPAVGMRRIEGSSGAAMAQDDGEIFIVPKEFFELNQELEDRTGSD